MRRVFLLIALILLAMSCAGEDDSGSMESASDAEGGAVGQDLFEQRVIGANPGCVTCHSLDEGVTLVGPSLAGLAARAGSSIPGVSAADYVRQSITEPDSFVVDGFTAGQMPGGWQDTLSPTQVESLVDFLLDR